MNLKGDNSERRSCLAKQHFHEHNFVNFDLLPPMVLQLLQKVARKVQLQLCEWIAGVPVMISRGGTTIKKEQTVTVCNHLLCD